MKEKILIIEDDPLIRNELKTLLQSNSYKTVAPEDFSDVIDQIKAEQPHLIILDIKLPGTSGFSLCTEIRTFSTVIPSTNSVRYIIFYLHKHSIQNQFTFSALN